MASKKYSTKLIDGRVISRRILAGLQPRVAALRMRGIIPQLAIVLVGGDRPSLIYVQKKQQAARHIGMICTIVRLPQSASEKQVIAAVRKTQRVPGVTGIIVQLPLPREISTRAVLEQLDPRKDVDCLTSTNLGKLLAGIPYVLPPTPAACWELAKSAISDVTGKRVAIVGSGVLVGRPLAAMLIHEQVSVSISRSTTKNLKRVTTQADIVVSGTGKGGLITGEHVKSGAVVIDAGVSFYRGKMHGDVDANGVLPKAARLTPVPGGVGPVTVAKLLENVVYLAEQHSLINKKK